MNLVQQLIFVGIMSTGCMFAAMGSLDDVLESSINSAIKMTAFNVEDVAQLYKLQNDEAILYSHNGYPSVHDGGVDKIFKSVGYINYYDAGTNRRVFKFNNENTSGCYFTYSDITGMTFMYGKCVLSDGIKNNMNNSFELESNQ